MTLRFARLNGSARTPVRAHPDDAGYDLHAAEGALLEPGERLSVGTGIALALGPDRAGLVLPRSGLAARHGVTLVNAPGLIDPGYRGEIRVLLLNTDRRDRFEIAAGDRIAQLVVVRFDAPEIEEVPELDPATERGSGGFGSTGIGARS